MSSNLKVNNILASSGDTVAVSGILSATSNVSIAGVTTFASGNVQLASDSQRLQLGSGQDLWMYHTGTSGGGHGLIQNDYGVMYMLSDSFTFRDRSTNHDVFKINENNAVSLYYQNSAKLSTTSTGAVISGQLDVGSNIKLGNAGVITATSFVGSGANLTGISQVGGASSVTFNDSVAANFGTDRDLEIYHNGTHAVISNTTGNLHIKDNSIKLQDESANQMIVPTGGQGVELYHSSNKKFETISSGVLVTGTLKINDGSASDNRIALGNSGDLLIYHDATNSKIESGSGNLQITCTNNESIYIKTNGTNRWRFWYDGNFRPTDDNTVDIGSSSKRVRNIYTADLHCSNRGSSNDVDGTWGDYTIQEGESDLFLINNRSGKKYKFNLTEVN